MVLQDLDNAHGGRRHPEGLETNQERGISDVLYVTLFCES